MRVAGTALFALVLVVAALPARDEPRKEELLQAINRQLRTARETAGPAVASVVVSRSDRYPKSGTADQPGKLGGYDPKEFLRGHPGEDGLARDLDLSRADNIPDHGSACGVVIDASGLVLTPYHVVDGATKVYVYLPGRSGSYADVYAADGRYDLAVLKLLTPPDGLTPLKFANLRLNAVGATSPGPRDPDRPLELVVLMANAGPNKPLSVLGEITSVRRPPDDRPKDFLPSSSYYFFGPFLELLPILNRENKAGGGVSGAAVLNLNGELVGLTTSAAAIGEAAAQSAFPADDNFRRVVEVLRRGEEVNAGYIGIRLNDPANQLHIKDVTPRGPADKAGIQPDDVIVRIKDVPVTSYNQLLFYLGGALADSKVKLGVARRLRDGEVIDRDVVVTLGKFRHTQPVIASVRADPVFGLRVDYGCLLAQGDAAISNTPCPPGVWARELVPDSPAAAAFKKLGDGAHLWVVTHVNGAAVNTPAEFYRAAKGKPAVKLTVLDATAGNGKEREVTLP
jgi:serine protease Do